MFQQLNFRVDYNRADYGDLVFPKADRVVLIALAKETAEIAARPVMAQRRRLWLDHNALKPTRPVLLCDPENGWNEIIPDALIKCSNSIARHWEAHFRKQIFWGNVMNDDYVVEAVFKLPYVYRETPWGVKGSKLASTNKSITEVGGAYHINKLLESYDLLKDVTKSELEVDYETTAALLETAHSLFDGILDVRNETVWFWSPSLTDDYVFLRGLEDMMIDFYDEPEGVHALMKLIYDGWNERLDFLENNGLLSLNNDGSFVGSGGMGFTDELPGADFDGHVKTKHMWGLGESQVTLGVSPAMFEEFIFPYQEKLMNRFGLTCYACCEPMDNRIDIVRRVKNLRRVSVSAWANRELMAEKLGKDYIYSLKPSPTPLSEPVMNENVVRKDIRDALRIARGNHLEIVMKDNHTLGGNPDNLTNFVKIVREEIDSL